MPSTNLIKENKTILVVDQDDSFALQVQEFLQNNGYHIRQGYPFDDQHLQPIPDLILMDHLYPDGAGISTCKNLKHHVHHRSIRILMMSAGDVRYHCLGAGANGFIAKPFEWDMLLEEILFALV